MHSLLYKKPSLEVRMPAELRPGDMGRHGRPLVALHGSGQAVMLLMA